MIDSEGTHKALAFMKEFWEAACDPGGFAWDDTSNNRAFLGQTIGATLNGASIYFVAKNTPADYPGGREARPFPQSGGPGRPFPLRRPRTLSIMEYSPNKEAAAEYIRWSAQDDNLSEFITVNQGYVQGLEPKWEITRCGSPIRRSRSTPPIRATGGRRLRRPVEPAVRRSPGKVHHRRHVRPRGAGEDPKAVAAWAQSELENVYGA